MWICRGTGDRLGSHLRTSGTLPLLFLLAALAGCGERADGETSSGVVTTDSLGVTMVANGEVDPLDPGFLLDSTPLFRVGWSEHPDSLQFATIRAGAILPSGNFAVADRAEIRVVGPDGSLEYSMGGPGEGPGEFQAIWRVVGGSADTLIVHDWGRGRVATFDGADLVSDIRLPDHDRINRNVVQGAHDGSLILPPTGAYPVGGPTTEWYDAPVLRVSGDGVDTIAVLDFARKGPGHMFSPFGWARVSGDQLIHAKGDEHAVRWYDLDGSLAQVSRWTSPRVEATDSLWGRVTERLRDVRPFSEMPEEEYLADVAEWRSMASGPLPTYSTLHGDPLGGAWLSEFGPSVVLPRRYAHVDADGVFRGSLELPDAFDVLAFGDGVVLGVERNDLGVSAAAAYSFSRVR